LFSKDLDKMYIVNVNTIYRSIAMSVYLSIAW